MIETPVNLDYLLPNLRLWIGDIDSTAYRYTTPWLRTALVGSVKALRAWWFDKYLIDNDTYNVSRNTDRAFLFEYAEPPIIDHRDIYPVIIMASIIIKSGSLQNAAWDLATWRDAEIYYSNTESGKQLNDSLKRDWDLLQNYLKPPQKRLAGTRKRSLIGFEKNQYERNITDLG